MPLAGLVGAVALAPYLNALTLGFAQDDFPFIVDNPRIMGAESALGLLTRVDATDLYRPLTMLSYALNAALDPGPAGFHLVNVALHVGVSLLVFLLVEALLGGLETATAAGLLFAAHPVHTEAVAGIVGRAELLAAGFGLLSLLALLRAERRTGRGRVGLTLASAGALLAAVLSKESGLTVLGLGAVVVGWARATWDPRVLGRALASHLAVVLAYLAWRWWLVGTVATAAPPPFVDNPLAHVPPLARLGTAAVVIAQYLGLLTVPLWLSSDYSLDQVPVVFSLLDPRLLIAVAVLAALVAGTVVAARRAAPLALAAAFFAIPLALTANVLFPIGTIKAERLLYLPSVGWCVAAGWAAVQLRRVERPLAFGVLGVVVALFAVRTWVRNEEWQDNRAVFSAMVRTAPRSAKAHANWGFELLRQRRLDEAIRHMQRAVEIAPHWAGARANLASALLRAGRVEEGLAHYERAVRAEPGNAIARTGYGIALAQHGRRADAAGQLEAALRLEPGRLDARYSLGLVLLQMGRAAEAAEQFAAAARVAPRHADTLASWGVALLQQGKREEAIVRLEGALRVNPEHAQARAALQAARARGNP